MAVHTGARASAELRVSVPSVRGLPSDVHDKLAKESTGKPIGELIRAAVNLSIQSKSSA